MSALYLRGARDEHARFLMNAVTNLEAALYAETHHNPKLHPAGTEALWVRTRTGKRCIVVLELTGNAAHVQFVESSYEGLAKTLLAKLAQKYG